MTLRPLRLLAALAATFNLLTAAPPASAQFPSANPSGRTQQLTSPEQTPQGLSQPDWQIIRAAYEAGQHAFQPVDGGWQASNPGQQWTTRFDGRGFVTQPREGDWTWGLELESYGFGESQRAVDGVPTVQARGTRLSYQWDPVVTEWWVNDQRGLEHGYTIAQRPVAIGNTSPAIGNLSLTIAPRGTLRAKVSNDALGVLFQDASGATVLNYTGLKVWDADGKMLAARFEPAAQGRVRLVVEESAARYPITIDPLAQQAYLKASTTAANESFGGAVAISGDTAVVGAYPSGTAYVFVRSGTTWTQQAFLKASNTGGNHQFGQSVAVSGDTIVVGAPGEASNATGINAPISGGSATQADNSAPGAGAAYVFVRSGTTWNQQAYLKASNTGADDNFGCSVAVSGDIVVVGAYGEDSNAIGVNAVLSNGSGTQADNSAALAGAAYVFVRSGTTWSQEAYLKASNTGTDDRFGGSVAVSGNTIAVGASTEYSNAIGINAAVSGGSGTQADNSLFWAGAAYVFVRSGTTWSQQAYLKASNTGAHYQFGLSVAVSGDTVVVGAPGEFSNATGVNAAVTGGTGTQADRSAPLSGAAYVFARSGTTWSQQAYVKASNTGADDRFGSSVAISGNTVVAGAYSEDSNATGVNAPVSGGTSSQADNSLSGAGAAYVFVRNGTAWSQQSYLKASNPGLEDHFGWAVAVSGDTVMAGAYFEDSGANGVNGTQADESATDSGAAYIFSPGDAPIVTTPTLANLTATGATLGGNVMSDGGVPITARGIVYARTADNADPQIGGAGVTVVNDAANITGIFTEPITSLATNTGYSFAAFVSTSLGTIYTTPVSTFITPPVGDLTATFTSATQVLVTSPSVTLSGGTANLTLAFAPAPGTELTVVKHTGLAFINGTFSNLPQGQTVSLSYNGETYDFVANYYGGTGNDLVLVWKYNRAMAWGYNSNGQLGDNSTTDRTVPVAVIASGVLTEKTILALAGGQYHSLALCSDGTVAAWGANVSGQLGDSTTTQRTTPVAVQTPGSALAGKTVVALAAGYYHSVALCSDGTVAAWGLNDFGQLGDNTTAQRTVPVAVNTAAGSALAGKTVIAIAAGAYHSMAFCSDGTIAAWGSNGFGQLGDSTTTQRNRPVAVNTAAGSALAGKSVLAIAAGSSHSLALCADGTAVAWGYNAYGQLGDNTTTTPRTLPVAVNASPGSALSGRTVVSIAAGVAHSVALCSDGALAAWGENANGEVGDGTTTRRTVPTTVSTAAGSALAGKTVVTITAGVFHNMALRSDGVIAAWGENGNGELGDNSTVDRSVPVAVNSSALTAGERFSKLFVGPTAFHSLALVSAPSGIPPPMLSAVTMASSNANAARAKAGDVITISFTAREAIQTPTVTIAGRAATVMNTSGNTWTGTITVAANDPQGAASFSVVYKDAAGNNGTAVTATTNGSNVTIDTAAPNAPSAPAMTVASDTGVQGDGITSNTTPTFLGTAEAGATVTLYDTNGTTVLGSAAATSGNYTIITAALGAGQHTITAKATDLAGNTGTASNGVTVMVETSIPNAPGAPVMTAATDSGSSNTDGLTKNITPTFTGTAQAGVTVTLYDSDQTTALGSAVATGGIYSITSSALSQGSHTISARAMNVAGTTSSASNGTGVTVDTTAPVMVGPVTQTRGATSVNGAAVTFSTTANDNVTTNPAVTFSPVSGSVFPFGSTVVTATATDEAGNTVTITFTVTVTAAQATTPASTGDGVPGAGVPDSGVPAQATWRTFGIPGLDDGAPGGDAGVPVFRATIASPAANPNRLLISTGIFGLGGATALLAKTGELAPETDQARFASFDEPVGNAGTAFIGTVREKTGSMIKATASGIWTNTFPDADGTLHLVARLGSPAADAGANYKEIDGLALNDGQHLFWIATLDGPKESNRALFLQSSRAAGPHTILQTDDSISGFPGVKVKSFIALREGGSGGVANASAGFGTGRPNGGATTPVLVTFTDKSTAIFNAGLNSLDFFARTHTATPDIANANWKTLGLPAAAGSTVAFRAILAPVEGTTDITKDNTAAIYVRSANHPLAALVRQGDPISNGHHAVLSFSDPAVNAHGDVVFFARIAGVKATGLFVARPQAGNYSISEICRTGSGGVPGLNGVNLSSFTGLALPEHFDSQGVQYPVFTARLKSSMTKIVEAEDRALFACDQNGVVHLLARTDPQPGGKILKRIDAFSYVLTSPAQSRTAASGRKVIYRAIYTDNTQAIVEVPMP